MPVEALSIGPIFTMRAGIIYALPAVSVTLYTDAAAPTLTLSSTPIFTLNTAVTLTAGVATLAGGFIKALTETPVILKRN